MSTLSVKEKLIAEVTTYLDQDIEVFDDSIRTPFGQTLLLLTPDGKWRKKLVFEHVGYGTVPIDWGTPYHCHFYLDWILRTWLIDRLQRRIDTKPVLGSIELLKKIKLPKAATPEQIEEILFDVLQTNAISGVMDGRPHLTTGARLLYQWGIEESLPGFDEFRLVKLEQIELGRNGRPDLVSMRDAVAGPFTRDELARVEGALQKRADLVTEAALFLLGRDWGLRPIQIALLREEDCGTDQFGPYVDVPSVKGIRRSRLRRASTNFVRRHISEDTREALLAQIAIARVISDKGAGLVRSLLPVEERQAYKPERPLFPSIRTEERLIRMINDPALISWALHADAPHLTVKLRNLSSALAIPNSRRSDHEAAALQINFLRLRRTKGTTMYLNGASLQEIAEALDHKDTGSVEHYARYNHDLFLMINAAQMDSKEIVAAAIAWDGVFTDMETPMSEGERLVPGLGKCRRNRVCPAQPTVTCYACGDFRPARDGDHRGALKNMLEERDMFKATSSIPIILQTNSAIAGALHIIAAAEEQ